MYRNRRSTIFNKFQCESSTELAFNKINAEICRFIHSISLYFLKMFVCQVLTLDHNISRTHLSWSSLVTIEASGKT